MLDRELLKDIGFVRGTGWDHEVWVYEGMFWLHYGDYDRTQWLNQSTHIDGLTVSRKDLFKLLFKAIVSEGDDNHDYI